MSKPVIRLSAHTVLIIGNSDNGYFINKQTKPTVQETCMDERIRMGLVFTDDRLDG